MRVALVALVAACGSSGASAHDAPLPGEDAPTLDGARGLDAALDARALDAAVGVPTYATPAQAIARPAGAGNGYGVVVAISADGMTLVTFDAAALYVFTRASATAPFPITPTQTITPPDVSTVGTGLSLSGDGALLACGAIATGGALEILVYTRQGTTYGAVPQVLAATSVYSEVANTALAPDGSELAVENGSGQLIVLPRSGSAFSSTPSATIPRPAGASSFFPMATGLSATGSTIAIGDSGVAGGGAVFIYTGGMTPVQTLAAISGESEVGSSVSLRADGEELVEGAIGGPRDVGVFQRGSSGYTRVQTIAPPTGATADFGVGVSLALDGTLAIVDYGAHIYIFAP